MPIAWLCTSVLSAVQPPVWTRHHPASKPSLRSDAAKPHTSGQTRPWRTVTSPVNCAEQQRPVSECYGCTTANALGAALTTQPNAGARLRSVVPVALAPDAQTAERAVKRPQKRVCAPDHRHAGKSTAGSALRGAQPRRDCMRAVARELFVRRVHECRSHSDTHRYHDAVRTMVPVLRPPTDVLEHTPRRVRRCGQRCVVMATSRVRRHSGLPATPYLLPCRPTDDTVLLDTPPPAPAPPVTARVAPRVAEVATLRVPAGADERATMAQHADAARRDMTDAASM